jgi:DNA-binding transcriptional MerR regulator
MPFTIGQLARSAQVPISTVRFYERKGLLTPAARSASNYRHYSDESLARLRFIRAAQASGFSIKDITEMLGLVTSDEPPCREVAVLIDHRLADIRQRMKELRRVEKQMAHALVSCCKGGPDWCREIERLKGARSTCRKSSKKSSFPLLTLH